MILAFLPKDTGVPRKHPFENNGLKAKVEVSAFEAFEAAAAILKETITVRYNKDDSAECEAFKNEIDKVSAKVDCLMKPIKQEVVMDSEEKLEVCKDDDDYFDDSSDEESDEEFMPDGEVIRKNRRGFKQLNNCRRFWKASLIMGKRRKTLD